MQDHDYQNYNFITRYLINIKSLIKDLWDGIQIFNYVNNTFTYNGGLSDIAPQPL